MTNEISQKDAVELAKWLGFKERADLYLAFLDDGATTKTVWEDSMAGNMFGWLVHWLISPEAQEAIMDKLLAEYQLTMFIAKYESKMMRFKKGDNVIQVNQLVSDNWEATKQHSYGIALTRQEALIKAVLQMIKGGSGK